MALDRPHPPSSQRIAEARGVGHVPRAPLVGVGVSLLALLAGVAVVGGRVAQTLQSSWRQALMAAGEGNVAHALGVVVQAGVLLFDWLGWVIIGIVAAIALVSWLIQGPAFAGRRFRGARFGAPKLDFTATVLWVAGVALVGGMALAQLPLWQEVDRELEAWGHGIVALALGCLIIDAALARARWFQSLWMTRREYIDAQREQGAAPELLAARARARREDT
jgi:flagellar biosynthesis protein FlhB